jgi:polysaccharide deacetylase family protein (PEP-CTERM system associated)
MNKPTHILSVDVEDYFQVEAFSRQVDRKDWDAYPLRVERNTQRLLEIFARHGATATFFFLGWVAERLPRLVREVVAYGHEIACHSYWHRPVYRLDRESFREDTRRAMQVIQDAAGAAVIGYRAPTWSITKDSLWALDILAEEGFRYDSSIFPIRHDLCGIPGAVRVPYAWRHAGGFLFEFPPSTLRLFGVNLPAAGGGYLRIFPQAFTRLALDRAEREGHPATVYLHPWELDPAQPRLRGSWRSRSRHYTGLAGMEATIRALLKRYRFCSYEKIWRVESLRCPSFPLPAQVR